MYIADLHIHSRYSRATSRDCTPEHLDLWARRKGIHIVGTGDFTHPAWREELKEKLERAEEGLYVLKKEYRAEEEEIPGEMSPRFVVTGEISSIYKKNGKVRKVHSLILLPGLEDAEKIAVKLEQIGNLHSDGRPILGLDCRDLLEILLELCPEAVYVPAHIWTPHFSLFGAFSGFDSVEECFDDLTPYIHAVETGLSSDPPMNWRVSALDRLQLISNSDAHSPAKLGREANLLDISLSYEGLSRAIQTGVGLSGTIEFFPEEGKYHMDGHRKCNLCLTPPDTIKYNGICPVCGRKITIGVSHRVEELADREEGYVRKNAKAFESLVPLPEVIGASLGISAAGRRTEREYRRMLLELGPEFEILRTLPLEEIRKRSGARIAEGIGRLRSGRVERIPGFDGEYGAVRLFSPEELDNTEGQMDFFGLLQSQETEKEEKTAAPVPQKQPGDPRPPHRAGENNPPAQGLNREQEHAVRSISPRIAVKAGPGTGKTKTLVSRMLYLLEYRKVKPSEITAVTFTNQAAAQMRERVEAQSGRRHAGRTVQIGTFHAICLNFLKEQGENPTLMTEREQRSLAGEAAEETGLCVQQMKFLESVSRYKSATPDVYGEDALVWKEAYERYEEKKKERGLFDFDDLLLRTAEMIEAGAAGAGWEKRFRYLLVDEFQDMNPLQFRLISLWTRTGQELFVIGDPDQSVYGFRGADAACFDRLKGMYPDLEQIELRENYRSSPQILTAASWVLSRGRQLHANMPDGCPVRLVRSKGPMSEAVFVAKEINRITGGLGMLEAHQAAWEMGKRKVRGLSDIAVLYRTHRQAELLEKCFKKEGIPYIVAGREDFLLDSAVQDSLCFFRYLEDDGSLSSVRDCACSIWNLEWNAVAEAIIRDTAEKMRPMYRRKKPQKFMEMWAEETGRKDHPAMQKLAQMSLFYQTMPEFTGALAMGAESDLKRCGSKRYMADAVTLMTLHGSKGLEFPAVLICGVDRGTIPLEREKYPTDTEEERRLLYVGMTRAREELILCTSGEVSEFLKGLPDNMLEEDEAVLPKKEENWHQMSLFEI